MEGFTLVTAWVQKVPSHTSRVLSTSGEQIPQWQDRVVGPAPLEEPVLGSAPEEAGHIPTTHSPI
jgi:hypothetical protein